MADAPLRLCLVLESNTDVRLIDQLAARYELTILARRASIAEFKHSGNAAIELGPSDRARYAAWTRRRLAGRSAFDAVIAQNYATAALGANLAARKSGIPTLTYVCNPMEAYYRCRATSSHGPPLRRVELLALELLARINARIAQRYVVLSRHLEAVVRRHGARCPVDVIPIYGVDTGIFKPGVRERSEVRAQLGLPTSGAVVLFSSRVAPEKDWVTLIHAFRDLLAVRSDVWLLNLSREHDRLAVHAAELGIAERLISRDMVNPATELAPYYQAANVCVQASREEGLGFAPLEALACGTPVVAAAVGGLRETIIDGETGLTYPPGAATTLADRLGELLDDQVRAGSLARSGRQMVVERYSTAAAFAAFDAMLMSITSSSSSS